MLRRPDREAAVTAIQDNPLWRPASLVERFQLKGAPFDAGGYTWRAPLAISEPGYYRLALSLGAVLKSAGQPIRIVHEDRQVPYIQGSVESKSIDLPVSVSFDEKKNQSQWTIQLPGASDQWQSLSLHAAGTLQPPPAMGAAQARQPGLGAVAHRPVGKPRCPRNRPAPGSDRSAAGRGPPAGRHGQRRQRPHRHLQDHGALCRAHRLLPGPRPWPLPALRRQPPGRAAPIRSLPGAGPTARHPGPGNAPWANWKRSSGPAGKAGSTRPSRTRAGGFMPSWALVTLVLIVRDRAVVSEGGDV